MGPSYEAETTSQKPVHCRVPDAVGVGRAILRSWELVSQRLRHRGHRLVLRFGGNEVDSARFPRPRMERRGQRAHEKGGRR